MSIKIALLKSGEQVVTDIKELLSEDKPVGYLFKDPEKIAKNTSPKASPAKKRRARKRNS